MLSGGSSTWQSAGFGRPAVQRQQRCVITRIQPAARAPEAYSGIRNHPEVTLLAVKVLLAPSFVVAASLAARRFGPRVGGLIAGLPVVAGPIVLAYALDHGRAFAAGAAAGTLLGLISLTAFIVVYGRVAQRLPWADGAAAGWLAFALMTVVFSAVSLRPSARARARGRVPADRPGAPAAAAGRRRLDAAAPAWDLPLRAACALALVLTLSAVAGWLGPQLSGLLAPFPIIATVLAMFTHAQRGPDEVLRLLRGLLSGFGAFALFFFTLALALRRARHRLRVHPRDRRVAARPGRGAVVDARRARARAAARRVLRPRRAGGAHRAVSQLRTRSRIDAGRPAGRPASRGSNRCADQCSDMFGSPAALSPVAEIVQVPPFGEPPLYAWVRQLRRASCAQ